MKNILRILLFEDPKENKGEVVAALRHSGTEINLLEVYALKDYAEALKEFCPDLILASFSEADSIGHRAFQLGKAIDQQLIFIGISSVEFENEGLKLLEAGAADYFLRDRLTRLPFAMLQALEKAKLKERETQQVQLLQKIPSAVAIVIGPKHVFQFANSFYQQLTGKEDVHGQCLCEVFTDPGQQFIAEVADQVYKSGETFMDKEVFVKLDEGIDGNPLLTTLYINFTIQALRNHSGAIEGLLIFGIDVTEQVQSRKETEQVNQEIDKLFDAVNEGFYLKDIVNNKYIQLSAGCPKIYGYTSTEFHENPDLWYEVIYPEDRFIVERDNVLLLKGEQVKSQYRIAHKDKSMRWLEVRALPNLVNGKLISVEGVVSDITQRKFSEEKIRLAEAGLSEAQKMAQIGSWNYDLVRQELTWSDGLKEIYWGDESLIPANQYFENLVHPDDRLRLEYEVSKLKRSGKNMKTSFRIINSKGKVKILTGENRIELDKEGKPIRLYGILQDVTSLKIAEETLKKSEANLRTLLNHTDAAYILVDHQLKIVSYSHLAQEIAEFRGYSKPYEGTHIFDYFVEQKRSKLEKIIEEVTNGKNISYEIKVKEKSEQYKWYAIKWVGVNDNEHKNWGFILSIKDITQVKILADQQNLITSELIRRNKDLEQFTYVVSHNLRAPVANIIGLSELMRTTGLDQQGQAELMHGLQTSIRNLDTVIKDLNYVLQVKKDAPGRIKEPVDIRVLVDEIKQSINHLVMKEQMVFECDLEVQQAYTIRGYLYNIFYNLILNSLKYHRTNLPPCLQIKSYLAGNHLNLVFKDNGKGIDLRKYGNQLFGLYKRFDLEVEGKGMGLFMVKTQIEDLGGSIQVESELEKGTTFHIILPV
ncbi:PAS domain S-box-containing protein [Pedobacter steynii]|uniref:histidine kinase n=1 Tax=Pedobacter steynii TaxID=430522 RepID=A0A1H0CSL7_9SPHI|nr:PAS domain-containing sensor histidine kinase [Pedobacter steynii]NQX41655.1 PAS domain-containing protein [Pedobacter steynii]SDN60864.1 PAS domain S-box-containing protein [Pedobacter steynii]